VVCLEYKVQKVKDRDNATNLKPPNNCTNVWTVKNIEVHRSGHDRNCSVNKFVGELKQRRKKELHVAGISVIVNGIEERCLHVLNVGRVKTWSNYIVKREFYFLNFLNVNLLSYILSIFLV